MKANKIEKAGREQEVKMKTAEKARRVDKIASLSITKKNTEKDDTGAPAATVYEG